MLDEDDLAFLISSVQSVSPNIVEVLTSGYRTHVFPEDWVMVCHINKPEEFVPLDRELVRYKAVVSPLNLNQITEFMESHADLAVQVFLDNLHQFRISDYERVKHILDLPNSQVRKYREIEALLEQKVPPRVLLEFTIHSCHEEFNKGHKLFYQCYREAGACSTSDSPRMQKKP